MNPPEGTGRRRIGRHRPVYRPHAALQGRVGILLHLLARRMDDAYREALADEGATWQMYAILAVTARVEGLSQNALAERIGLIGPRSAGSWPTSARMAPTWR